ncbi:hypothetical protein BGZ76_006972, partial [Entomortierella beljakovae]
MNSAPFIVPCIRGSDYFQGTSPEDYNAERFIIFRGGRFVTKTRSIAKEWNAMKPALTNCPSQPHAKWAEESEILNQSFVKKVVERLIKNNAN